MAQSFLRSKVSRGLRKRILVKSERGQPMDPMDYFFMEEFLFPEEGGVTGTRAVRCLSLIHI